MGLRKLSLLTVLLVMLVRFGAAQHKDEAFNGPHDPIKIASVFPNPAIDFVSVRLEHPDIKKSKVTLHNIIGSQLEFESEIVDEHELRIRVKDFPAGYYFLSVRDDISNTKGTYKFLKR
jgi:hypothetical protein